MHKSFPLEDSSQLSRVLSAHKILTISSKCNCSSCGFTSTHFCYVLSFTIVYVAKGNGSEGGVYTGGG